MKPDELGLVVVLVVLVAVGAMHMSVLEFLGGGVTHFDNFDVEVERDTGQGVVGIQLDFVPFDTDDRDHVHPLITLRLELHADFDVDSLGHLVA